MTPLVEKVLKSGLVDRATAELMEHFGYLEHGASETVNEDGLKNATHETLEKVADELATEVEKAHALRETYLDLERLRWPVSVSINNNEGHQVALDLSAVTDRMGRYYFRIQDVKEGWFVPGYELVRRVPDLDEPNLKRLQHEVITECQVLYIGEQGVCLQVSTR